MSKDFLPSMACYVFRHQAITDTNVSYYDYHNLQEISMGFGAFDLPSDFDGLVQEKCNSIANALSYIFHALTHQLGVCHFCRARRAAKEAKEAPAQPAPEKARVDIRKFVKIGRPGYKGRSQ